MKQAQWQVGELLEQSAPKPPHAPAAAENGAAEGSADPAPPAAATNGVTPNGAAVPNGDAAVNDDMEHDQGEGTRKTRVFTVHTFHCAFTKEVEFQLTLVDGQAQ